MSAHHRQLSLQAAAALLIFSLAWPYYYLRATAWDWAPVAAAIGGAAFAAARLTRQPWWWQIIHLLFAPLLWAGLQLQISPLWYLGMFMALFLIFRGAASGQIPLYLSGANTAPRLAALLPRQARMLDIGAGIGSLLLPLGSQRPDLHLSGIENAPLPWLAGWLRTRGKGIAWCWGDLWQHRLAPYQTVYCFLSPAPMIALWHKACQEMHPGALFISKAFPIPGQVPEALAGPAENPVDRLYIYRIPG
ncbi:class I SAM-dependent methyltransferase [Azovibrio restrictus]|uniref:class I SAM-dependent methyltransferase n=1 Tax=Azovibrio restrictus TaxID=146938 RepID=UPI0026EF187B|nr:class I SAM-dependent methyltransferase [Azovibrio restrictus]MDD3482757.1 class I SAM-dependent methyltransferase [Azovibrio restrictus]